MADLKLGHKFLLRNNESNLFLSAEERADQKYANVSLTRLR